MLNSEDRRMSNTERDASPERFGAMERRESHESPVMTRHKLTSSHAGSSVRLEEISGGLSRIETQQDNDIDLERHPTALSRIQTGRSQQNATVGNSDAPGALGVFRTRSSKTTKPLPAFGAGKPYPPPLPEREEYVVEFDGPDDPLHAQNWPMSKKLPTAAALGFVTLTAAFGSSIFSAASTTVAHEFGVSSEVGILGISLYVLGFATGPILWAPMSELYGRRIPLTIASFGFSIFAIAVAVGKDLQTVLICRFFGGFFGAAPLTVVGAVFADMFNNRERGIAVTVFSIAVFSGPLLAPFIGGFIVMNKSMGWRWTEYIVAIMGFFGFALLLLLLEETYPPIILVNKASELRRRTKNWGIHAKQEEIEVNMRELLEKNLSRPMRMLVSEPIVLALSIYMAFVYGLLYLFLTFYPIVFQRIHGMNPGVGGLPYFGMILGEFFAGVYIVITQPSYNRKLAANNNIPIPEWRLPPVIIGGVLFGLGLIWFGFSGYKEDVHWIVPTLSGLFTGFGIMSIFLQCLNYLIDAYLMFAASAIAANTFLRSICGAVFPLFATYMIDGMGIQWAGLFLGLVAFCLVPLPIIFYTKGAQIRKKSQFAPVFPMASQASAPEGETVSHSQSNGTEDLEKQA